MKNLKAWVFIVTCFIMVSQVYSQTGMTLFDVLTAPKDDYQQDRSQTSGKSTRSQDDYITRCIALYEEVKADHLTKQAALSELKEEQEQQAKKQTIGTLLSIGAIVGGIFLNQKADQQFWQDMGTGIAIAGGISTVGYLVHLGYTNKSLDELEEELNYIPEAPTFCQDNGTWDTENISIANKGVICTLVTRNGSNPQYGYFEYQEFLCGSKAEEYLEDQFFSDEKDCPYCH